MARFCPPPPQTPPPLTCTKRRLFVFTPGCGHCSGRNLFLAKNYFDVVQPRIYTRCSYVNHDTYYVLIGIKKKECLNIWRQNHLRGCVVKYKILLAVLSLTFALIFFLVDHLFWVYFPTDPPTTPSRILDFRKLLSTLLHF
jgi:hypothetical protein